MRNCFCSFAAARAALPAAGQKSIDFLPGFVYTCFVAAQSGRAAFQPASMFPHLFCRRRGAGRRRGLKNAGVFSQIPAPYRTNKEMLFGNPPKTPCFHTFPLGVNTFAAQKSKTTRKPYRNAGVVELADTRDLKTHAKSAIFRTLFNTSDVMCSANNPKYPVLKLFPGW